MVSAVGNLGQPDIPFLISDIPSLLEHLNRLISVLFINRILRTPYLITGAILQYQYRPCIQLQRTQSAYPRGNSNPVRSISTVREHLVLVVFTADVVRVQPKVRNISGVYHTSVQVFSVSTRASSRFQ